MSIYAYTGLPGSGKSYDVVANQVLPALKAGREVVTNIPLHLDALAEMIPNARALVTEFPTELVQSSPERIEEYARPGVVLILDEVWRLWAAGLKANQVPEPFRKLLAEHRHMVNAAGDSMQIVLVTQDLAQISAFARQLVETTFHHTKLTSIGASGSYRIDVYNGPVSGPNPPRQSRQREIFGRYDAAIFKLYKSHTMSMAEAGGANEASVDGRNNIWRRPMIYVGLAFVVVCLVWGIPQIRKSFNPQESLPGLTGGSVPVQGERAVSPLVGGPVAASSSERPLERGGSDGWRVAGVMRNDAGKGKALLTNGRYSVTVDLQRFCEVDLDLGPRCQFEGGTVTMYSEQRFPSPANSPASQPAVLVAQSVPSAPVPESEGSASEGL